MSEKKTSQKRGAARSVRWRGWVTTFEPIVFILGSVCRSGASDLSVRSTTPDEASNFRRTAPSHAAAKANELWPQINSWTAAQHSREREKKTPNTADGEPKLPYIPPRCPRYTQSAVGHTLTRHGTDLLSKVFWSCPQPILDGCEVLRLERGRLRRNYCKRQQRGGAAPDRSSSCSSLLCFEGGIRFTLRLLLHGDARERRVFREVLLIGIAETRGCDGRRRDAQNVDCDI
jgi:hypothetical protein